MIDKLVWWWRSLVSTMANPKQWLVDMFGGGSQSKSGAKVTTDTAVQVTAVFACVRLLAQTLASLPLHTYERVTGGKVKATDHPLYFILHSLANEQCTSYNLRLIMMFNLLLTGDAFAEIERDRAGRIIGLWPIPSGKVTVKKNLQTAEILYEIQVADGQTRILYDYNMWHIQWVGMENFVTYNPVILAREAIGLSIAAEEFGSLFFENGANASGIAEYPGKLSDEAYNRYKKSFTEKYAGLSKAQRVMFLEEGLKFTKLTVNPNEAQAVETRKFQVVEIARFFNVPPHLIMDLERATFDNIEHQDIGFVKYSLRPYLVCWEQEMVRSLFRGEERKKYFAEFNVDGLLRGDAKSRAEAFDIMRRNGVINADEWRAMENMNPQPDGTGEIYYVPQNWMEIGQVVEVQQSLPERKRSQGHNAEEKLQAAHNFKRLFSDAAERIVNREASDIRRKTKDAREKRSQEEFTIWLEEYYREAPEWMKRAMLPTLLSYTETIQRLAAEESGAEPGMTPELEEWMDGYADNWARDYTRSSEYQIKDVINQANDEGEDAYDAVDARLDSWQESTPKKVADKETIEASGVVSKFTFAAAGVTRLMWINAGGDPCPYCQELHGRVVGIDRPFVGKNDVLDSEDGTMSLYKPTYTPQLHRGCECQIVPE